MNRIYFRNGVWFFVISCLFPVVIITYFYLWTSATGWFFQDDFGLLSSYKSRVVIDQLGSFDNFGRFISRNVYYFLTYSAFGDAAQYFYVVNWFCMLMASLITCAVFSRILGLEIGLYCGFLYYCLPSAVISYVWIANIQHILGHLLVLLFVYRYLYHCKAGFTSGSAMEMSLLVFIGLLTNIFFGLVLSLPLLILISERHNLSKYILECSLLALWIIVFFVCIYKLKRFNVGVYATRFDLLTLKINLKYYFSTVWIFVVWVVSVLVGSTFFMVKGKPFSAWLFCASVIFLLPYAFQTQQRYLNYALFTYLFFGLGVICFLNEAAGKRWAGLVAGFMVFAAYIYSLSHIKYYTSYPVGVHQKKIIADLRHYMKDVNGDAQNICFGQEQDRRYLDGALSATLGEEWTRLSDGFSFAVLVDPTKNYILYTGSEQCDVRFNFTAGGLEEVKF